MNFRNLARAALVGAFVSPWAAAAEPVVQVQVVVFTVRGENAAKVEEVLGKVDVRDFENDKIVKLLKDQIGNDQMSILTRPQLLIANGKPATFQMGNERKFVTGLTVVSDNGAAKFVPKEETIRTWIEFQCTPTATADRKSVRLDMNFAHRTVDEMIPLVPVTTLITPVFEGGSKGTPVPFTQFIQQPKVDVAKCEKAVNVASDQGTLVNVGTRMVDVRTEMLPPEPIARIPYLNRLFKNVAIGKETETTFLCIRAKAMTSDDLPPPLPPEQPKPQPVPLTQYPPAATVNPMPSPYMVPPVTDQPQAMAEVPPVMPQRTVARASATVLAPDTGKHAAILKILMEQYRAACLSGDTAKARTIAAHCIELDPMCFAR